MKNKEAAKEIMWPAVGKVAPAVWREMVDAIAAALAQREREVLERGRVCDECRTVLPDGSGFCATCDNFTMPSDLALRWVRRTEMEKILQQREREVRAEERERAAKIADGFVISNELSSVITVRAQTVTAKAIAKAIRHSEQQEGS